jgi:hypothetical protein
VYEVSGPKAGLPLTCITRFPNSPLQRLKKQDEYNRLILDLAKDMACTLSYIENVKQFALLGQHKQAIKDVTPFMEDATNFIVEFTCNGQVSSKLQCFSTITNSAIRITLCSPRKQDH